MFARIRNFIGLISLSKTGLTIVKSGIAIAALGWLISQNKLSTETLLSIVSSWWILPLLLVLLFSLAFQSIRWWCLLRLNRINLPLRKVLVYSWIGQFFQMVTPGTLGAEVSRFYYITRIVSNAKTKTINSVFLDRLLGLAAFFALALIVLLWVRPSFSEPSYILFLSGSCVATLLVTVATIVWMGIKEKRRAGENGQSSTWGRLLLWVGIASLFSFTAAISMAIGFQISGQMLDTPLSFSTSAVNIPFVMIANGMPVTPGGLGLGESISMLSFAKSGYVRGAELMFIIRFCLLIVRLPGLLLFLALGFFSKNKPHLNKGELGGNI